MLDRIIFFSFALLFFLVPLFWTPLNFELFEYNKMMLTYGLTIVIVGTWLLKIINQKSLIFNRTPLDIPFLLFLGANILSTVFSIDQHTSIWGYYSRSNGGLLSLISYLLLYWAFVSNINKGQVFHLLKIGLVSGVIVSLWGILEHFGVSPSCVILRGDFNADCWVQDVQSRVFATLGQPNWMAAYLAMLIFPCLYFVLTASALKTRISYFILLISIYMAFTFTFSRGGFLGFLAGLGVFVLLLFERSENFSLRRVGLGSVRRIFPILIIFFLINLLFGSALTRFNLSQLLPESAPQSPTSNLQTPASTTQLENGGTESGQIRLIVWQGALEIFKHYPLLGSGVETFAYAYYQFRPPSHNLVSEWDFLYNKAHNEFLNYLATTGIVGFTTYVLIILTFMVWCLKKIVIARNEVTKQSLTMNRIASPASPVRNDVLLTLALLASYISYLVQNFFGFSVVIIALFFFLFPAIAFVVTDSIRQIKLPPVPFSRFFQIIILLTTFYLLFTVVKLWYADTYFSKGVNSSEKGNLSSAVNSLSRAVSLNPNEPYYRMELAYAAAAGSTFLDDATSSGELKNLALEQLEIVLKKSPKNVSFWRTTIRTYFELSSIDAAFNQKTIAAVDRAISLASTDAKLYYNKAVILGSTDKNLEAIEALKKAVELKPNYRDSFLALGLFYFDTNQNDLAVKSLNTVLKLIPNDPEALEKLNEWGKMGIATESAINK